MFNALANGITSVAGAVYNAVVSCITQAITYIKALPAQAVQWGSDFINGLARGITSAANAVVEKVRGIAENIRSMLHFSRPDEGPLRDYEKWPVDFIHGYADAMRGAMPYLQKTLDGITAGMAVMVNGSPLATAGAGAGAVTNNTTMNQTVNITSPQALSPGETARQTRFATRDLLAKLKG